MKEQVVACLLAWLSLVFTCKVLTDTPSSPSYGDSIDIHASAKYTQYNRTHKYSVANKHSTPHMQVNLQGISTSMQPIPQKYDAGMLGCY